MMLGTSIINRENREANAKLQREIETLRSTKEDARTAVSLKQETERTRQAREDIAECLARFDSAMQKLNVEAGKIAHRTAK